MFWSMMLVWLVAVLVATQINRAIDGLAWHGKKGISPWAPSDPAAAPRNWWDRIPILGWWFLRRESAVHGRWHWLRPLLIELLFPLGIVALYRYELAGGLLPFGAVPVEPRVLHFQFISHALLLAFLTVATFIDLDEQTIPDAVTIPGTVLGLSLAALLPESLLPAWRPSLPPIQTEPLVLTMPGNWSPQLVGLPGLFLGWVCIAIWWYALVPKTSYCRRGWRRFVLYLIASIRRHPMTPRLTWFALVLGLAVTAGWYRSGRCWQSLLSSLVGLASAVVFVWMIRVVATSVLQQEALGFGDVTLMGMIGTFLGWQSSVIVFFLAPFTGVVVAVLQWLFTGRNVIAYGPFLCLGALVLIVGWPFIWRDWGLPAFSLGWFIPIALSLCVVMLGVMLAMVRWLKSVVRR